jgi:hypothetical protein
MQNIIVGVRFLTPMDAMVTQQNLASTFPGNAAACPLATGESDAVFT